MAMNQAGHKYPTGHPKGKVFGDGENNKGKPHRSGPLEKSREKVRRARRRGGGSLGVKPAVETRKEKRFEDESRRAVDMVNFFSQSKVEPPQAKRERRIRGRGEGDGKKSTII